jgi:hypothetical protein
MSAIHRALPTSRSAIGEGFSGAIVPFGDDLLSLEALKQELDDTAWLERVVEACKL